MRKFLLITIIFSLLTLSLTQSAIGQRANVITNQTSETVYVVYSTKFGAQGAIPAGYRTQGWKTIAAGQQRTFYAYDPHQVYFQIWKGSKPVKPRQTTETFAFWIHRSANFNIVTDRAIHPSIGRGELRYSSHNTSALTRSDGFIRYNNGSRITVTTAWVAVNRGGANISGDVDVGLGIGTNLRRANVITNETSETVHVMYSTKFGEEGPIPAGYRTHGWRTIAPGQERTFHAYDPHQVYFQIWKGDKPVKPRQTTETFAFWIHRSVNFNIVTSEAIHPDIVRVELLYSSHNIRDLTRSEGFMEYDNGSHITITNAWVDAETPHLSFCGTLDSGEVTYNDDGEEVGINLVEGSYYNPDTNKFISSAKWTQEDTLYEEQPTDGIVLTVRFQGGTAAQRNDVKTHAPVWSERSGVRFRFLPGNGAADIVVSFRPEGSSWSVIGWPSKYSAREGERTMNIDYKTYATSCRGISGVIKHEFGHALGFKHEHQSPSAAAPLDMPAIIKDATRKFDKQHENTLWPSPEARRKALEARLRNYRTLSHEEYTNYTAFDPKSIMLYMYLPLRGGGQTPCNGVLSETDKRGVAVRYPKPGTGQPGIDLNAPVHIPDASLRAALESALRKGQGATITHTDMLTLTAFTARGTRIPVLCGGAVQVRCDTKRYSIRDLTGLQAATNLTFLNLSGNNISDISPLATLTNLKTFSIHQNNISDISPLATLTNLKTLSIHQNNISDISPLATLTNLRQLLIYRNNISDFSPINELIPHLVIFKKDTEGIVGVPLSPSLTAIAATGVTDVNQDSGIDVTDLVLVSTYLSQPAPETPRVDIDTNGIVTIADLVSVAQHLGQSTDASAPASVLSMPAGLTYATVEGWIRHARLEDDGSSVFQRGIAKLEYLLTLIIPEKTALLPNYPNPFNPETWLPYHLAEPGEVTVRIYSAAGRLVRRLDLGHQAAGYYQSKSRAVYWDGRNAVGERVASGLYFYTLTAGDFTATRKMLIRK